MAKHKTGASENTCHLLALTLTHDRMDKPIYRKTSHSRC
jgi:hypothetical protein